MNRKKFDYLCQKEEFFDILLEILQHHIEFEPHTDFEENAVRFFRKELVELKFKLDRQKIN